MNSTEIILHILCRDLLSIGKQCDARTRGWSRTLSIVNFVHPETPDCHSERSEESPADSCRSHEILRRLAPQNDTSARGFLMHIN